MSSAVNVDPLLIMLGVIGRAKWISQNWHSKEKRSEKLCRKEYVPLAAKKRMYLEGKRAKMGILYAKIASGRQRGF
jgi:hypothetical protein